MTNRWTKLRTVLVHLPAISSPWGKSMPPLLASLLEWVYVKSAKAFGYYCGVEWSHEAIVARSNLRPERMQKLKVAANSGQNPGFELLQECWAHDPALQIVIKKLLVKFPQWGMGCWWIGKSSNKLIIIYLATGLLI